jgi:ribosomal protein S16
MGLVWTLRTFLPVQVVETMGVLNPRILRQTRMSALLRGTIIQQYAENGADPTSTRFNLNSSLHMTASWGMQKYYGSLLNTERIFAR